MRRALGQGKVATADLPHVPVPEGRGTDVSECLCVSVGCELCA